MDPHNASQLAQFTNSGSPCLVLTHTLRGHEEAVESVKFSRDGRQIATCETGKVCIHDAKTGTLKHKIDSKSEGRLFADFTMEGGMLFARGKGPDDGNSSVIWAVQTSPSQSVDIKTVSRYYIENLTFSPDGRHAAFGYGVPSGERLGLLAIGTDRLLTWRKAGKSRSPRIAWSPDGLCFAFSRDESIRIVGGPRFKTMIASSLDGHTAAVKCLAFSKKHPRMLASGGADTHVMLWEKRWKSRYSYTRLRGHTKSVNCIAFLSEFNMVSGSADHTVRVWSICHSVTLQVLHEHTAPVKSVIVSPDEKMVVSGGKDKVAFVWRITTQVCDSVTGL
jgi:WD40 repeat protein